MKLAGLVPLQTVDTSLALVETLAVQGAGAWLEAMKLPCMDFAAVQHFHQLSHAVICRPWTQCWRWSGPWRSSGWAPG